MIVVCVGLYLGIGFIATGVVFALFPPEPGYRPARGMAALAAITFAVFWPFVLLLGLVYVIGPLYCRWRGDGSISSRAERTVRKRGAHAAWLE